jgi:hypothetical protein
MSILRKDTVDGIVSDFTKVIGRLRTCAEASLKAREAQREIARKADEMADAADHEAQRATVIANKIEGLLS